MWHIDCEYGCRGPFGSRDFKEGRTMRKIASFFTLAFVIVFSPALKAQNAGDLDTTFGVGGKVLTAFGADAPSVVGSAIGVLPSGRIFLSGSAQREEMTDLAVSCFDTIGRLESTFDGDGRMTMDLGSVIEEINYAMAVQRDDRIVVAGSGDHNFLIARFHPDGTLDRSFGPDGTGKVRTNAGHWAYDVAIQSDDKILVSGYFYYPRFSSYRFAVVRLNPNGVLDTSFGGGSGYVLHDGGPDFMVSQNPVSVALQQDGKIVLAGTGYDTPPTVQYGFFLMRLNIGGTLDNTFGSGGRVFTNFGLPGDQASDVLVQPDGKIVVAGRDGQSMALVRYTVNGTLDRSFDGDGIVTNDLGDPSQDLASSVTLQPDTGGKILVTGHTISEGASLEDFFVARYNTNGSLDSSFSGDGMVMTDFGGVDVATSLAMQTDGKILVGGVSCENGRYPDGCQFAAARYLGQPLDRPEGLHDRRRRSGCTGIPSLDRFKKGCQPFWYDSKRYRVPIP